MNRTSVGFIAVLLLIVGAITAWRGPQDGSAVGFAAGCIRVGLVLAALWFALPQIKSLARSAPKWLMGWFGGRGKQSDDGRPRVPVKRPRRRSNS